MLYVCIHNVQVCVFFACTVPCFFIVIAICTSFFHVLLFIHCSYRIIYTNYIIIIRYFCTQYSTNIYLLYISIVIMYICTCRSGIVTFMMV